MICGNPLSILVNFEIIANIIRIDVELKMYLFFIYTSVRGSTIIKTGKIRLL